MLLEVFAISSAIILFGLAFALTYREFTITFVSLQKVIITLVSALLLISSVAFLFIYRGHRFRYIYAVEQFKRYHADEQWIAFADDVFDSPEDKYLVELKKQCIKNGFGLLSVSQNLNSQLLITPTRDEIFDKRRVSLTGFDNGMLGKLKVNKVVDLFSLSLIHI